MKKIFITGGAGYVGAVLVPKLLDQGYEVTVLDWMLYGADVLPDHEGLNAIKGDIRDKELLERTVPGHDAVIHLACISNDPSFELDPELGRSVNLDPFEPMVKVAKEAGVQRFIYASSSSVYGIKDEPDVHEGMELEPLTDYSRFKVECERILQRYEDPGFTTLVIRPATVCGYSPRLRLDLTVNLLTNHAVNNGKITVFGGEQKRPNIHIQDMAEVYRMALELPKGRVAGGVYNAGYENYKVKDIAQMVKDVVGPSVAIETTPSDDQRSYHISSEKIRNELGFVPQHTIKDAIRDLVEAFDAGLIPDPMENDVYYNVRRMKRLLEEA